MEMNTLYVWPCIGSVICLPCCFELIHPKPPMCRVPVCPSICVAIAGALSLPLWLGVTFLALLLVGVLWILHDPRLPNDALLALCSATLLCSGLLFIQHIPSLRPELLSYLFGDLLTISWADLPVFALVIIAALAVLYKFWQGQIQIAIEFVPAKF